MKKRTFFSLSLFGLLTLSFLTSLGSMRKVETTSATDTVTTDFGTVFENSSAEVDSNGYKNIDINQDYNVGDGTKAKYHLYKGDSTSNPNLRLKNSKYYLYLKYPDGQVTGNLGAYVEFSAVSGYKINGISWEKPYTNQGYQIQIYNSSSATFTIEKTKSTDTISAESVTFSNSTSIVRVYCLQVEGLSGKQFALQDISIDVSTTDSRTLTFDTNGGSSISPAVYGKDDVTVRPQNPTKIGDDYQFVFVDWFNDSDCTAGNEFIFGNKLTENKTIYAKWQQLPVATVTTNFLSDIADSTVLGDTSASAYKKFTADFDGVSELNFYKPISGNKDSVFKLVPSKNTASDYVYLRKYPSESSTNDTHAYLKYASSTNAVGAGFNISPKSVSCEKQISSITITDLGISGKTAVDGTLCILASSNGTNWTSFLNLNFDSSTHQYTLQCPTNTKYVNVYSTRISSGYAPIYLRNISINYCDAEESVTLKFDSRGGSAVEDQVLSKNKEVTVKPEDPTKEHSGSTYYEFAGWYTDDKCTTGNEFVFGQTLSVDTTVYAKWNEVISSTYKMHFETGGYFVQDDITTPIGEPFVKPTDPTIPSTDRYNYIFNGWYTDSTYKTLYDWSTPSTDDLTVYAKVTNSVYIPSGASNYNVKNNLHHSGGTGWADGSEYDSFASRNLNSYETFDAAQKLAMANIRITSSSTNSGMKRNDYEAVCNDTNVTFEVLSSKKIIKSIRVDFICQDYYEPRSKNMTLTVSGVVVDTQKSPYSSMHVVLYSEVNVSNQIKEFSIQIPNINTNKGVSLAAIVIEYQDMSVGDTAEYYSKEVNNLKVCGTTPTSGVDSTAWAKSQAIYEFLDDDVQSYVSSYTYLGDGSALDEAIERYDAAVSKHPELDYMGRITNGKVATSTVRNVLNIDVQNFTPFIIIICLAALAVPSIYFFIRRRKEN